MQKAQYALIIVALLTVGLLFALPKVIVKDDRHTAAPVDKQHVNEAASGKIKQIHKAEISEKDQKILNSLTKSYYSVLDKEKKLKFVDSLAGYYQKLHLYDSSSKYFELELKMKPSPENYVKAGDSYFEAFSFNPEQQPELSARARQYYQSALEKDPGNLDIKNKIAATYIGTNEAMEAVVILREIIKADPKNKEALYSLGLMSIQSNQLDKAVGRFEEILKYYPQDAGAHFYLGVSYLNLGEKEKAKDYFMKARTLSKDPAFQASVDEYLKEL
ncbi:MAG: tetratricopeptide repeat protein [Cytophagaceae bacterium]